MSRSFATFEPGSVVYEPFLGLCHVTNSSHETMLGIEQLFYQLKARQDGAVIKVPAGQMVSRGIRVLLTADQIQSNLAAEPTSLPSGSLETYTQRLRRWTQLVRSERDSSGYLFLREWHQLSMLGTRLSPQENQLYERIHRSLSQEIAEVLQISAGRAAVRLNQWLGPANPAKEKKSTC